MVQKLINFENGVVSLFQEAVSRLNLLQTNAAVLENLKKYPDLRSGFSVLFFTFPIAFYFVPKMNSFQLVERLRSAASSTRRRCSSSGLG